MTPTSLCLRAAAQPEQIGRGVQIHLPLYGIETQRKPLVLQGQGNESPLLKHRQSQSGPEEAITAIKTGRSITIQQGIVIGYRWGMLLITLPSGRTICYPRAEVGIETNDGWRGDHEIIEYEGLNQTTKKWGKVRTYGGKLTENIVQATARDILGCVILRAERRGLNVVFHIHDEIIVEATKDQTLPMVEALFSEPIPWCKDLPLKGAGYTTPYYLKD